MQVTNELLQKFASMVNNTDDTDSATLEFYGHIEGSEVDGYWTVRPDALTSENTSLESLDDDNLVQCTSQVAVKNGDQVRYKIDGTDAVIIENLSMPNGNDMAIVHIESDPMPYINDNPSAGNAGHLAFNLTNSNVTDLIAKGYRIIGLGSNYLKIRDITVSGSKFKIIWEDADALANMCPTLAYLGCNMVKTDNIPTAIQVAYFVGGVAKDRYNFIVCGDIIMAKSTDLKIL